MTNQELLDRIEETVVLIGHMASRLDYGATGNVKRAHRLHGLTGELVELLGRHAAQNRAA